MPSNVPSNNIASNTMSANNAISKLTGIDTSAMTNQTVSFTGSNIPEMTDGKNASNQLFKDLTKLSKCILDKAHLFSQMAETIEERDRTDAGSFGGK
ncbi:hypothetical protein ACFO26_02990 [Lactococcus nasutitermitis]|uniref:TIGR04197 family type VII secretion effector n=1 Tax=Lactococcus nasutitermitis TaxID=1652957 RepID=A0ABV9JC48_9LACT|nr:TIGR04197 family type VII secretion effector [Lactococcus nasutitermitis]